MRKKVTHIILPPELKKLARIRATQEGVSVSTYFAGLVQQDVNQAGIANLLSKSEKEIKNGKDRAHP